MALLDPTATSIDDSWIAVADDAPLPDGQPALVSLARLKAEGASMCGRNAPVGVSVPSTAKPEDIEPYLHNLALVAIQFPVFRDGRGFTIARALRERFHFAGDIRATGHTLPDQFTFLIRCGFNQVETPGGKDAARWVEALGQYTIGYQPAITDDSPLSLLRRHVGRDRFRSLRSET